MAVILGIDLGTSSVKAMLFDTENGLSVVRAKSYEVEIPEKGFAEQDPEMWWSSLLEVLQGLKEQEKEAYQRVEAIGYSGQMHGMVLVGEEKIPLMPAILWLDRRSEKQLAYIHEMISKEEMGEIFCNRVSSGFAFPSLLWVKENKPEIFAKTRWMLSPKDYIRMKMTGIVGAEVVDASSTGVFATAKRDWAWGMIRKFEIPVQIFPKVHESIEVAGTISEICAAQTGLPQGIPVIYGTGDQPAQSIGNGVIDSGKMICNIGTGGQISAYIPKPLYDKKLRTNTFCHGIPGAYTIFGATLCSGMSMNWIKNKILQIKDYEKINDLAANTLPGAKGLIYLPYLSGERTPHMNPNAKGVFFGLTLEHGQGEIVQAVMEGVVYSLKECLEILQKLGVDAPEIIASGGGATSKQWLQIQADILNKPVRASRVKEQACLGACLLAAVGTGIVSSLKEACERFVFMDEMVYMPRKENEEIYTKGYEKYRALYQCLWKLM